MSYKRKNYLFNDLLSSKRNQLLVQAALDEIRAAVRKAMDEWTKLYPKLGPCWAVSRALGNAGCGRVEYCHTYCKDQKEWYGHYVVRTPQGKIIDCSGEYICQNCKPHRPLYHDYRVFDDSEHDAYPKSSVQFWQKKLRHFIRRLK